MYVCICKALTEKDIHQAVASGCNSVRELKRQTGLASECGRCASCAKGLLRAGQSSVIPGLNSQSAAHAAL